MSGGIRPQPEDRLAALMAELDKIRADVRELQRPTGTQIAEIVANQVVTDMGSASASSVSVGTSFATIMTVTIPVPAGFSHASVITVGAWTAGQTVSGWTGGDRVFMRMVIGGAAGPESSVWLQTNMVTQPVTATATRVFDVTPGGTLTVLTQARNRDSATDSASFTNANMSALVLFTR